MTRRILAHEKFRWNGWEFRQSLATSQEVHWEMRHGKLRVRVTYRDIQDTCCWCQHDQSLHTSNQCVPDCACAGNNPSPGKRGFAPEVPPEWTAIIHFQGLEEGRGVIADYPGGSGIGSSLDAALTNAADNFQEKLVHAARLSDALRRGKPPDP